MKEMFKLLKSKGYKKLSLSVQKENYAYKMYLKTALKLLMKTKKITLWLNIFNQKERYI